MADLLGLTLAKVELFRPSLGKADEFADLYRGVTKFGAQSMDESGIDLTKSRANADFGCGFYATTSLRQAQEWGVEVLHFRVLRAGLEHFQAKKFLVAPEVTGQILCV